MKFVMVIFCALNMMVLMVAGQGDLLPSGAPAPAFRTLEQIEPRFPISSLPYTISDSGSYYLTGNLTSTGHGVIVEANNVTLDLMGFSLIGDQSGSDYGIYFGGAGNLVLEQARVRNGSIRNFSEGVRAAQLSRSWLENLNVCFNGDGIKFLGTVGPCNENRISQCVVSTNGQSGLSLEPNGGQCNYNIIEDCVAGANGAYGIILDGGGQCIGNTLRHCKVVRNGEWGIYLFGQSGQCDGNSVLQCTSSQNAGAGIYIWGANGVANGNVISECLMFSNAYVGVALYGSSGQCKGNKVQACTMAGNATAGIDLTEAYGNWVDGNMCSDQIGAPSYGIRTVSCLQNIILRNVCIGQTSNYSISANDTYGPIVTNVGVLASSGDAAHPWANFSR